MKKLIYPIICISFLSANSEDLISEYKMMFEKISEQRVGLEESQILRVKSPFISKIKKKVVKTKGKKQVLSLDAIFGNKAMINGKWYKLYSKVGDTQIVAIKNNSILIKSDGIVNRLRLRKDNAFISIK